MKKLLQITIGLLFVLFLAAPPVVQSAAAGVDYSIYTDLLHKYVHNGVVDYAGFQKEQVRLDEFLSILENTGLRSLNRDELMAFYINLYNAWTIKLILTEYPGIKSIRDIGSIFTNPWKLVIVRAGGKVLHLDNVEHDILRPQFKDPRVHFAVNCASKSCPPLISEPYTGARLQTQLQENAIKFINNPKFNYMKGNVLFVSKIFKWFSEDFNNGDIIGFVKQYARGVFKKRLDALDAELELEFLDYDWSLNGK